MNIRLGSVLTAVLLAAACAQSSSTGSQSSSDASAGANAATPGSLEGIKYRVPMYPSDITAPASISLPGAYQFQTSDDVSTVMAWYKVHVPSGIGGEWVSSDPSGTPENQDWNLTNAKVDGGHFSIDIEHVRKGVPIYAAGSKTIVEVGDD